MTGAFPTMINRLRREHRVTIISGIIILTGADRREVTVRREITGAEITGAGTADPEVEAAGLIEIERRRRRRVITATEKRALRDHSPGLRQTSLQDKQKEVTEMLMPKRVKYRRVHRGRMKGKATRGNKLSNGDYGLMAVEPCWITSNQIEAARISMTRYIRRGGNVWIKIFPDKPVTEKPAETRMGSGKGSPEYWVAVVKPGRIMFEMDGIAEDVAREAMRLAMHKLPVKCKFVTKKILEDLYNIKSD